MGMVLRVNFENHVATLQAGPSKSANKKPNKKSSKEIKDQLSMDDVDLLQSTAQESNHV